MTVPTSRATPGPGARNGSDEAPVPSGRGAHVLLPSGFGLPGPRNGRTC